MDKNPAWIGAGAMRHRHRVTLATTAGIAPGAAS
jgi:hypothetical protein